MYKGVPLYLEPIELDECIKGQASEAEVWATIVQDLTDAINESNLPNMYESGSADYGHVTKSVAYALRGKAYLYQNEWAKAAADFEAVGVVDINFSKVVISNCLKKLTKHHRK